MAIIFQMSSVVVIYDGLWVPDAVLMLILAWALIDGFEKFLPWAILTGLLYDLSSYGVVGINVIVFVLAAYAIGFFSKRFSTEMKGTGLILSIFFVISATISSKIITSFSWFENNITYRGFDGIIVLAKSFIFACIWNMIFFILWFYVINKVEEFFYLKRKDRIKI